MLYIDDLGQVKVNPDFEQSVAVVNLKQLDKTKDKSEFAKWITYAYHMYKRDHKLANFGSRDRLQRVQAIYFSGEDISTIETQDAFKDFKLTFIDLQHTVTSRFIENLKKDMEELLTHIRNIPLTRKELVPIDIKEGIRTIKVERWVDVDNSDEKFKALRNADNILSLYDKFAEKLKAEQREEKRKSGSRRLFDRPNV